MILLDKKILFFPRKINKILFIRPLGFHPRCLPNQDGTTKMALDKEGGYKMVNSEQVQYDLSQEPIVISKGLLDLLLKQDRPADLIALYTFYYYTAKWQQTNQPKATTKYVAKGLKWSESRVQSCKKVLLALNLIEDGQSKNDKGQITGHYVRVNFVWGKAKTRTLKPHPMGSPPPGNPTPWKSHPMGNLGSNASNNNNRNALNNNNNNLRVDDDETTSPSPPLLRGDPSHKMIVPSQFDMFWKLYQKGLSPPRGSRGEALVAWEKLCRNDNKKNKRPTWRQICEAIVAQKKSERWQNPKFIPHASTWLNNYRWLDDPEEMKSWTYQDHRKEFRTSQGDRILIGPNGGMAHCVVNRNGRGSRYEPDHCIKVD